METFRRRNSHPHEQSKTIIGINTINGLCQLVLDPNNIVPVAIKIAHNISNPKINRNPVNEDCSVDRDTGKVGSGFVLFN